MTHRYCSNLDHANLPTDSSQKVLTLLASYEANGNIHPAILETAVVEGA